jgi:hypothetical protein
MPTKPSRAIDERRKRLVEICQALPEVEAPAVGSRDEHIAFRVRKKTFAYYLFDHHGDGKIALWCKAAPGEQGILVEHDPRRFFVPPYLGPKGWIGLRLDLPKTDWGQIAYLVDMAYRLSAPRALVAKLK